ncbi:MAG: hypothetical protein V1827_06570, partial [Candidatus Micrarchaeota archaeon]
LSAAGIGVDDIAKELESCRGKLAGSHVDSLIAAARKGNDLTASRNMHREFVVGFKKRLEECGYGLCNRARCS